MKYSLFQLYFSLFPKLSEKHNNILRIAQLPFSQNSSIIAIILNTCMLSMRKNSLSITVSPSALLKSISSNVIFTNNYSAGTIIATKWFHWGKIYYEYRRETEGAAAQKRLDAGTACRVFERFGLCCFPMGERKKLIPILRC